MRAGSTREFLALCSIVARFGRPGTPTDQAWIESLFGHVKGEWPHLEKIRDPAQLVAELEVVRADYNGRRRRHAGIGLHTAASVHYGTATEIRAKRAGTLDAAYAANPARFCHRRPTPPKLPTVAWINEPSPEALIRSA